MSHMVASKVFVSSLSDAREVGAELGFELVEGATSHEWYNQWMNDFGGETAAVSNGYEPSRLGKCEHKLRRVDHKAGMYEIGLYARADGKPGWELLYDNWGSGGKAIEEKAGKNLGKFKAFLGAHAMTKQARREGYRITKTMVDNKIRVSASR
jgi:hypothetical protein